MTMRARQVNADDFQNFDLIVAMDHNNVRALLEWDGAVAQKVKLARSFDASATTAEVPDPYYGTPADFTAVANMLELACEGLLAELAVTR